jgi:lipocalin-like protein
VSRQIEQAKLLGRWRIVEWVQRYDDGREVHPLGRDLQGFIQYDRDRVFCFLCCGERPALSGGQWTAPQAEKAAAYASCLSYSGTYEIFGNEILHKIDLSLYPNWVGTVQRRGAAFHGDRRIALTARLEEGTGDARTAELTWERESSGLY